jgi:hypothetical protein
MTSAAVFSLLDDNRDVITSQSSLGCVLHPPYRFTTRVGPRMSQHHSLVCDSIILFSAVVGFSIGVAVVVILHPCLTRGDDLDDALVNGWRHLLRQACPSEEVSFPWLPAL